jgi:toxin ParE1/3/4
MAVVRRSSDARSDLTAIWLFIAKDNMLAADRLVAEIDRTLERAAKFPFIGEAVDHLRARVRRIIVGNYQLFYQPTSDRDLPAKSVSLCPSNRRFVPVIIL